MSDLPRLPTIIQGGMGVAVSNWVLANAVAKAGQLGVVSGTALDTVVVRRLQDGDRGGHVRRAMAQFPVRGVSEYVLKRFLLPEGRDASEPYRLLPLYRQHVSVERDQITMLGAFVEVTLAKEGHVGPIGINLLSKIQLPTLPTLYGAMLAGVDVVLMGAGIPRDIPGALDALARHEPASIRLDVIGAATGDTASLSFDPRSRFPDASARLFRPRFLPIVSAASLAITLARKSNGRVDGFVVEGPTAGGHNAPPRGALRVDDAGEPIYGERDVVDLAANRVIGHAFGHAGGAGSPEALEYAVAQGAAGIQAGTLFAFSDESGFTREIKDQVILGARNGTLRVRTDVRASPTGYPFKVIVSEEPSVLSSRPRARVCDLGALRELVRPPDGTIVYRCPAEPVDQFLAKGGALEDTVGRQCLCNALCACIGLPQQRADGTEEPVLVTSGDEVVQLDRFLAGRERYTAADVIGYLTRTVPVATARRDGTGVMPSVFAPVAVAITESSEGTADVVLDRRADVAGCVGE